MSQDASNQKPIQRSKMLNFIQLFDSSSSYFGMLTKWEITKAVNKLLHLSKNVQDVTDYSSRSSMYGQNVRNLIGMYASEIHLQTISGLIAHCIEIHKKLFLSFVANKVGLIR